MGYIVYKILFNNMLYLITIGVSSYTSLLVVHKLVKFIPRHIHGFDLRSSVGWVGGRTLSPYSSR